MKTRPSNTLPICAVTALCAGAASVSSIPSQAQAAVVHWTLSGVRFDDGGTATGSFLYDSETDTFSDIAITTTVGSAFPGEFFQFDNPDANSHSTGLFVVSVIDPVRNTPAFNLNFVAPLTDLGGIVGLDTPPPPTSFESRCADSFCDVFFGPGRRVLGGVATTLVPLPSAFWLFGSAAALTGLGRRLSAESV